MHFGRVIIPVMLTALLAGCQTSGSSSPVYQTNAAFSPEEASFINVQGTGRIKGSAYLETPNGRKPAARSKVTLVPATAYARERVRLIYGNRKMASAKSVRFQGADRRYHAFTRSTMADIEGNFTFKGIGPGEYFVTTAVVWSPGGGEAERTSLINQVNLGAGEVAEVTLNAVWN